MMAYDKELRPDNRLSQNVYHGASSEGSLSPDTRSVYNKALCYTIVEPFRDAEYPQVYYTLGT